MLYYLKKYPLSLLIIAVVVYLSFFKPPVLDLPPFPYYDKVIHFCMYGGMSGMLWVEFLWNHRKGRFLWAHGLIGGTICPVLFSGMVEVMQAHATIYRSGDWFDFMANTAGVVFATLIAWYVIRPCIQKYMQVKNGS